MMKILNASAISFGMSLAAVAVEVSAVSLYQPSGTRTVNIDYTLSAPPAIVRVDIQTNSVDELGNAVWASVGEDRTSTLAGDVDCVVSNSSGRVTWKPRKDFEGFPDFTNNVRAVVKAHPLLDPPEVLVVNLEDGSCKYYDSLDELPGSISNPVYRLDKLVLRRIHAAGVPFRMGMGWEQQYNTSVTHSTTHMVTLTKDFYIGVFELTIGQYNRVTGNNFWNSRWTFAGTDGNPSNTVPMTITYNGLRGSSSGAGWPNVDPAVAHSVDDNSFLGKLRKKVGGRFLFDLPTDAQWEFACRAGTYTTLPSGVETKASEYTDANVAAIACYYYNGRYSNPSNSGPTNTMAFAANNFGLYDMIGNVREWCLDWYAPITTHDPAVDPVGPATGTSRVNRGGGWVDSSTVCTSGRRAATVPGRGASGSGDVNVDLGARICLTIE